VAHVLLNFRVGGLENLVAVLVPQLVRSGIECAVYCVDDIEDGYHRTMVARLRKQGVSVTLLSRRRGIDVSLILRLRRLLRGADIVHSHNVTAHLYGGTAARLAGVPVTLATRHGITLERRIRFWLRVLRPLTDCLICVAERVANEMVRLGIPRERICVVPNGVDLDLFDMPPARRAAARRRIARVLRLPEEVLFVGAIGRIAPEKGLPTLLEAFAGVHRRRKDVALLIVGDGPLRGDLERYVLSHNLEERVFFLGTRKRPALWIGILDVLALPSYSEGMPMVVLEAFAAGVPVVASDVGGTGEVIENGTSGLLIPPRDVGELERALCEVIEDPATRARYGSNAREAARNHYSIERIAETHAEIYSRLLAKASEK
jgi:glycosyltransferase involved in cell wall biosynthesis